MSSRFWALVLATLIALALLMALVLLRSDIGVAATAGAADGSDAQAARLHVRAMHDELCEVWDQDSQRVMGVLHERYGADPADVAFIAGLLCPFNR